MQIFAIVSLIIFLMFKLAYYIAEFAIRREYITDNERVINILIIVMSIILYCGCYYMIIKQGMGYLIAFVMAIAIFVITLVVLRFIRWRFFYITASDNYECYLVAKNIIAKAKKRDGTIILDDNIPVSNSIKISFDTKKISRQEMVYFIKEQYIMRNAKKGVKKVSLLTCLLHATEVIIDISFIINIIKL